MAEGAEGTGRSERAESAGSAGPLLWIGGWASGLACWRAELEARYPGREHRFLDAHAALSDPDTLAGAAAALPEEGVILAWSLGSLLLHRALASGSPPLPDRRAVSLCPVFDFCAPGSPWPPAVLGRMLRRLSGSRDEVLSGFWTLVRGSSPVSAEAETAWRRQAEAYPLEALASGLEALGRLKADPDAPAIRTGRLALVASAGDPLAPAGAAASGQGRRGWTAYPAGHLPFLDYPEIVRPLLEPAR